MPMSVKLENARRAMRAWICSECECQPISPEFRSADRPRPCEGRCALFQHLAEVERARVLHLPTRPFILALRQRVCCNLCSHARAGLRCTQSHIDTCPLGQYLFRKPEAETLIKACPSSAVAYEPRIIP